MTPDPGPEKRILYGRRRGHKLRPGRQELVDQLLPHLAIAPPDADGLDPAELFAAMELGEAVPLWLEIGFGGGEHLAAQAEAHRDTAFIGCEPFVNGIASLLSLIEKANLGNVRIWADDARGLIEHLPDASVDRAFLLYPDPWPKARHAKRRFVASGNLDQLARVLKDGAQLRIASDHPVYQRWTLCRMQGRDDFAWSAERADDWRQRPDDWPETRYEQKAVREGRTPMYLEFTRRPRVVG